MTEQSCGVTVFGDGEKRNVADEHRDFNFYFCKNKLKIHQNDSYFHLFTWRGE